MPLLKNEKIICQECSNGCNLFISIKPDGLVVVGGNKCGKGLKSAKKSLSRQGVEVKKIRESIPHERHSKEELIEIAGLWNIDLLHLHPSFNVAGSPERTAFRVVLEDVDGQLFILEEIFKESLQTKKKIASTLEYLKVRNLQYINAYLRDETGRYLKEFKNNYWQIEPFVKGVELDRAKYLYEKFRGTVLADFLIELKEKSADIPHFKTEEVFSLRQYVESLNSQIEQNRPDIANKVREILDFLKNGLFKIYDDLPFGFCHGDYHPLNIIWAENGIKAVIDWEFHGIKTEIYDVANMVGCLGIEHPLSLTGELVMEFIGKIKKANIFSDISWQNLVDFIVAQRFAWLSEWLRKKDEEMVELELTFMKLLIENEDELKTAWEL